MWYHLVRVLGKPVSALVGLSKYVYMEPFVVSESEACESLCGKVLVKWSVECFVSAATEDADNGSNKTNPLRSGAAGCIFPRRTFPLSRVCIMCLLFVRVCEYAHVSVCLSVCLFVSRFTSCRQCPVTFFVCIYTHTHTHTRALSWRSVLRQTCKGEGCHCPSGA